jgi:hypothetical protein
MTRAKEFMKIVETGEMGRHEIEPGGDWYGLRQDFERICKQAGVQCEVRPFDQYQGPYVKVQGLGTLWLDMSQEGPDSNYVFEYYVNGRQQWYMGFEDDMIDFLKGMKKDKPRLDAKDRKTTLKNKGK